jgi:hypothetical protein
MNFMAEIGPDDWRVNIQAADKDEALKRARLIATSRNEHLRALYCDDGGRELIWTRGNGWEGKFLY